MHGIRVCAKSGCWVSGSNHECFPMPENVKQDNMEQRLEWQRWLCSFVKRVARICGSVGRWKWHRDMEFLIRWRMSVCNTNNQSSSSEQWRSSRAEDTEVHRLRLWPTSCPTLEVDELLKFEGMRWVLLSYMSYCTKHQQQTELAHLARVFTFLSLQRSFRVSSQDGSSEQELEGTQWR